MEQSDFLIAVRKAIFFRRIRYFGVLVPPLGLWIGILIRKYFPDLDDTTFANMLPFVVMIIGVSIQLYGDFGFKKTSKVQGVTPWFAGLSETRRLLNITKIAIVAALTAYVIMILVSSYRQSAIASSSTMWLLLLTSIWSAFFAELLLPRRLPRDLPVSMRQRLEVSQQA